MENGEICTAESIFGSQAATVAAEQIALADHQAGVMLEAVKYCRFASKGMNFFPSGPAGGSCTLATSISWPKGASDFSREGQETRSD